MVTFITMGNVISKIVWMTVGAAAGALVGGIIGWFMVPPQPNPQMNKMALAGMTSAGMLIGGAMGYILAPEEETIPEKIGGALEEIGQKAAEFVNDAIKGAGNAISGVAEKVGDATKPLLESIGQTVAGPPPPDPNKVAVGSGGGYSTYRPPINPSHGAPTIAPTQTLGDALGNIFKPKPVSTSGTAPVYKPTSVSQGGAISAIKPISFISGLFKK